MLNSAATQNQLIGRYLQQSDSRFFKENNLNVETNEAEYSSDGRMLTKKSARFHHFLVKLNTKERAYHCGTKIPEKIWLGKLLTIHLTYFQLVFHHKNSLKFIKTYQIALTCPISFCALKKKTNLSVLTNIHPSLLDKDNTKSMPIAARIKGFTQFKAKNNFLIGLVWLILH